MGKCTTCGSQSNTPSQSIANVCNYCAENILTHVKTDWKANCSTCGAKFEDQHIQRCLAAKPLQAVLADRQTTHGNLVDNSSISQGLQTQLHESANWKSMAAFQKESLQMICHKIGRIVSGDPYFDDHWIDIAGYAQKVSEVMKGLKR